MGSEDLLWKVRAFIYSEFAGTARPPTVEDAAARFGIPPDEAASIYQELQERHAIFLEPGTVRVRMAFPFSGIPTGFKVRLGEKSYWANCAWDMFGIPAALHSDAASMDAACAESGEPIHLEIRDGKVVPGEGKIHFAVPFSRWYEDLPYT